MSHSRILTALVLALSCLVGCGDEPHDDPHGEAQHDDHGAERAVSLSPEAYAVAAITVEPALRRVPTNSVEVTGNLAYDERHMAIATARIGGRIAEIVADYGARVSAGDVLAWIDSPDLGAAQAEYRRAINLGRVSQAEYERARLLLEGQAISRGELLRREAEWRSAQADLETAHQRLHILGLMDEDILALEQVDTQPRSTYPVRAPISGKITERDAAPGQVVAAETELFVVANLDELWLFLQIFEKDLHSVTTGSRVELSCEAHPQHRFTGSIDFVGEILDPHSRTVSARAVIDNTRGWLKPGMFVYAQIEDTDSDETPVLLIPADAVTEIDGHDVVFVETQERRFEVREVAVAPTAGRWREVRGGIIEGERIAIEGVFTLKSEVLKGRLEGHDH